MIWVSSRPTPPAAAWTSAVWPGSIRCEPVARYCAVSPCSGIAAAASADTPCGTRMTMSARTATFSA